VIIYSADPLGEYFMKVRDLLKQKIRRVYFIENTAYVRELVNNLAMLEIGAVVVLDETNQLCGIVSERDVIKLLARNGSIEGILVEQIMTKDVVSATEEDSIDSVMEMMTEGRFRHLPILNGKEILGIISIGDVVAALASDLEYENQVLKEYVMGVR
jgi:CBS domain-containing protein